MLTKVCTTCEAEKSVDDYHKHKTGKYGVRADCKCCCAVQDKAYKQANREAVAASKKVYRQANREAIVAYQKSYREANREAIAKQEKSYKQANKEMYVEQRKAHYQANREAMLEKQRAYKQANPHINNALEAKRKATKLKATPAWADQDAIQGMYQLAAIFNRTGINLHVDHIVPLQGDTVCGLHCEANLQLMPASDNISKGNRHWPEMP